MSFLAMLLFAAIVSLDGFFAGTAYGLNKINVPSRSLFIIGTISFICTALAIILAATAAAYFPVNYLGATLLIIIGITGILFKHHKQPPESKHSHHITFSIGRIVINIIRRPERADLDKSNDVSSFEAIFLGVALGLDNTAAAFAAALNSPLPYYTPLIVFVMQIIFINIGMKIGQLISPREQSRLSYLPPIYFIILGLINLLA